MKALHRRCAGLDVHSAEIVACARLVVRNKVEYHLERFATTVPGLLALVEWLEGHKVKIVAMEATGVYWKPVWHILEEHFELVLANAQQVKNVPGRKSDVNDAVWLSDLLAHGLIRASFVPPRPIRELRDLTRTRRQLKREAVQHHNRILKVLEDANIKLSPVLSDVLGASGRRMLKAMVAGETDPAKLASLGDKRLKCTREELIAALTGTLTRHHRFMLGQHLRMIEEINGRIAEFDAAIAEQLAPFRDAIKRLKVIPGLGGDGVNLAALLAEIGTDMSRFPSAGHLLSWARLVPRQDESAGKKRSTRVKQGGWLKPMLVQAAHTAAKRNGSYLQAQFRRLAAKRGDKKAAIAVAGSILTAAYHMLRDGTAYQPPVSVTAQDRSRTAHHLVSRLKDLGYTVEVRMPA